MHFTKVSLKGEATWVITNAISQSSADERGHFVSLYGDTLINALVMNLRDL